MSLPITSAAERAPVALGTAFRTMSHEAAAASTPTGQFSDTMLKSAAFGPVMARADIDTPALPAEVRWMVWEGVAEPMPAEPRAIDAGASVMSLYPALAW